MPGIEATKPHELLTEAMREGVTKAISKAFDREAERKESDVEPPDYLAENLDETQGEYWDSMDDRDKFNWAKNNAEDYLGHEGSGGSGEIDEDDANRLRKLTQSNDPKAIWLIADSQYGKDLLLGSDWNGFIDLHDKETMARFDAYVGTQKGSVSFSAGATITSPTTPISTSTSSNRAMTRGPRASAAQSASVSA